MPHKYVCFLKRIFQMRLFPSLFSLRVGRKLPFCQSTPAECEGEKGRAAQRSSGMEGRCLCFHEDRMRLGSSSSKSKLLAWNCSRLSFSLFHEDRMRIGSSSLKSKLLAWNCSRLSLSLRTERTVQKKGDDYACIHVRRTREIRIKGKAASGVAGRAGCYRTGDVGKHLYQ